MPRATQSTPAKKPCKYGNRVDGKCPPKPTTPKKPCKYGDRVEDKCPPKPVSTVPMRHRAVLRDSIQGLKKPEILRLARKAGIVMLSGLMYEEIRGVIKIKMDVIIKDAIILSEYAKRKTILPEDVLAALKKNGLNMYWSKAEKLEKCAISKKSVLKTVRHTQKQSECVYFGLAPFRRLIKEILGDFRSDARIGTEASNIIQVAIEEYVVHLFEDAQLQAIHGKRKTVQPQNVQLARRVRGDHA